MGLKAALIALCLAAAPQVAHSDASALTGADFLEMNGPYRAGLVQGMLAAVLVLGVPQEYQSVLDDGIACRVGAGHRRETIEELSTGFARYLEAHPDDLKGKFPLAFLLFLMDCPKK